MVPVNYFAILVCGVANMIIGFLWYGPLFGKPWADMMGFTFKSPEEQKAMQKKMIPGYAITFILALITAYVLSHSFVFASTYLNVSGYQAGLSVGFWSWLGFILPITIGSVIWESKPIKLWTINASYWLVSLLVTGVILAIWK